MYKAIIFSFSLLMSLQLLAQKINIIPQPTTVEEKSGSFTINKSTPIVAKTKDEIKSDTLALLLSQTHYLLVGLLLVS